MRTIEITVDADGNATVDAVGFSGPACKAETRAFEEALEALGGVVVAEEAKAELRAAPAAAAARRRAGGGRA